MTTTLQELDKVLASKEGNEPAYMFDIRAGDLLRNHAPEIRAALEMKSRVDASVKEAMDHYDRLKKEQDMRNAAPPAQRDEKGRPMTYWGGMPTPAQGGQDDAR